MTDPAPPSMTEDEWFPPGGPHPTTVSPTLMVTRPPAQIPEGLLDPSRPKAAGVVRLPPPTSPGRRPTNTTWWTAVSAAAPTSG